MADEGPSGFLPPEPPGPEPDLGDKAGEPTQQLPPPTAQTQPLPPPQPYQPPPQYQQPPPQYYQPPPQQPWQQPYGYGPPPGYHAWGPPPPREPDNNKAVAGFVFALVTSFLWLSFLGFPVLGIGTAVAGLVLSRQGKREVASGRTTKNAGLAQAGWIISIVMVVLTVLSTLAWIVLIVALATDEEFRRDLEDGSTGTIAIALVKGILSLLT